MSDDIITVLEEFFRDESNVTVAILYGSAAHDRMKPGSDVDIAVMLVVESPTIVDDLSYALELILRKEVDILVLNRADPIISMQVLIYGILLKNIKGAYENFFAYTTTAYHDLKITRKPCEDSLLRRFADVR